MEWMGKNNKAIAFLRVSSTRQRDNTSHETQEQEIVSYCQKYGLDLVRIIPMIESAKDSSSRKQYREGFQWAQKNQVRHHVFYIFDRETRNLTDNERNENLVRENQIVMHYARESRVYHVQSPDSDFFLRDIQAVTNKQYSRQLSTKILDAMRTKAEGGQYPGCRPPLGYVHHRFKTPEGKESRRGTIIVPDPVQKNLHQVQREFELRAAGYSVEQLRRIIISEGFILAARVKAYHKSTIEYRLRNPFYWGEFEWQGERYKGNHQLIIPAETLRRVAESFARKSYQRRGDQEHGLFAGGWLTCADQKCRCNIIYDPKTKKLKTTGETRTYHYYLCSNGRDAHPNMRGRALTEENLWRQFGDAVGDITMPKSRASAVARILNETHEKLRAARRREIESFRQALVALECEEDTAYQDLRRGLLSESMYDRQIKKIRDERKNFTQLLEHANSAIDGTYLKTAEYILELATEAKSLWESASRMERLDFLKRILSNQMLDGISLRYELRKPFAALKLLKADEDWSSQVDTFRTALMQAAA